MTKYKRNLLIAVLAGVLVVGDIGVSLYSHHDSSTSTTSANKPRNTINYSPPTEAEQQAGNQQKQQIVSNKANQAPPQTAEVVITNTSQAGNTIRVRALISNVIESGGSCTTALTNGSHTVTKTTVAFADASTTQCGAIDFTRDQFAVAGNWAVSITYSSPALTGNATGSLEIK